IELSRYLRAQPPWSDLPILLLTRQAADSPEGTQSLDILGNVTLLELPTPVKVLVSAARVALRARERQFQMRGYFVEREKAAEDQRLSDRCKDEFLATLAHELRNPLAPLRNSLHILRLSDSWDDSSTRLYEVMERQLGHLIRLVDDLLELSRI